MFSNYGFSLQKKSTYTGNKYLGKYRGQITKTDDPLKMGRIKGVCPRVFGPAIETEWALPCLPPGFLRKPVVGEYIWFEFEEGDPDFPIWTGVWYTENSFNLTNNEMILFGSGVILESTLGVEINANNKLDIAVNEVDINADTKIIGQTDITGATTIIGNTTVTGEAEITGGTTINGNTEITGGTTITGPYVLNGNSTITGNYALTGNTTITGNSTVTGNTIISNFSNLKTTTENASQIFGVNITFDNSTRNLKLYAKNGTLLATVNIPDAIA